MLDNQNFPEKYIPEFFHTIISHINNEIQNLTNKFENTEKDLYNKISEEEKECLERSNNILSKIECLSKEINKNISDEDKIISEKIKKIEELYHEINKEIFKVKELYKAVTDQSKLNVGFTEQFKSVDNRMKWLFKICIILLSSLFSLIYYLLKS